MSAWETIVLIFTILNKIAVVGIAVWAVWALQTIFQDNKWTEAYPFLGRFRVRFSVALIAAGFAIDAFSIYTPSLSEVVMNFGIFIGMHLFRVQYRRNQGHHPLLDFSKRRNQKQQI